MDNNFKSDTQYRFAYCITIGSMDEDELTDEQRTAIIRVIEGMLQERDHTQNESK